MRLPEGVEETASLRLMKDTLLQDNTLVQFNPDFLVLATDSLSWSEFRLVAQHTTLVKVIVTSYCFCIMEARLFP